MLKKNHLLVESSPALDGRAAVSLLADAVPEMRHRLD
jgi:hypothetical protein